MISTDFAISRMLGGSRSRLTLCLVGVVLAAICMLQVTTSLAASAATSAPSQNCPPDCGKVAAGDPLLIPYVAVNPGLGWLSLPASGVQSYASDLKTNLSRSSAAGGVTANVAAARWKWSAGGYSLLIDLVSSDSLQKLHLASPAQNAEDLCAASKGQPGSQLVPLPGVPGSVSALCLLKSDPIYKGATVAAFQRGNVAVLIEIESTSESPILASTMDTAGVQQYLSLPSDGVLVSTNGLDVGLLIVWVLFLLALLFCIVVYIRREGSWRALFTVISAAISRRKLAIGIAAIGVVGAMAFSMLDFSLLHGVGEWYEAGFNDFWRSWATSADMTYSGGYGHIYILNNALETAPAWLTVIAPISRLTFGLPFPYPSAVIYPSAFWIAGPIFLGAMVLPICGADRWLQYMGLKDIRRRVAVLGVMAVTLPPIALFGHSEDLIALGAMLYGLIAAMEGRHRACGLWLGTALAFQFLAFLAIPIALVLLKRKQWVAALIPMVVVPLSVLIVPLASEPSATVRQIIHQKVFYDLGFISPTWYLDPGVGAFIRIAVALAAIPAAFALARFLPEDRKDAANIVLWVLAAIFALRICEPELLPYFLAPTLALLPISASRGPTWKFATACALSVWLNWWLHDPVLGRWPEWLFLVAQFGVLAWLGFPTARAESKAPVKRSAQVAKRTQRSSRPSLRPRTN